MRVVSEPSLEPDARSVHDESRRRDDFARGGATFGDPVEAADERDGGEGTAAAPSPALISG
jgi:hypothetical protein